MRLPALLIVLALASAAPALGFFEDRSLRGDLDGDGTLETVRTVRAQADPSMPPDDDLDLVQINIADTCPGDTKVAGPQESLGHMRLADIDPLPGKELRVDLRSGATGRGGEYRVVAWRLDPSGCGVPRQLFRYLATKPTRRPRGTLDTSGFSVIVKQLERRYRGKEVVLYEGWLRNGDASCCPSVTKASYYRYDAGRDRYVRYKTAVRRIKSPGGADLDTEFESEPTP